MGTASMLQIETFKNIINQKKAKFQVDELQLLRPRKDADEADLK